MSIKIWKIISAVGAAAAIACGTLLAPAAASASSHARPYAWELRRDGIHIRHKTTPGTFWIMVGGPNVKVKHLHWSS